MAGTDPEGAGMRRVETDTEVLYSAINDAINIYVRDALIPRGLIDEDEYHSDLGLDELRNKIANEVAKNWAVSWFDPST